MECQPRKAADNERRHSKTEEHIENKSKAIGVGVAKPIAANTMALLYPAVGHVGTGLCVCLPAFQPSSDTFAIVLFLPLGARIFAVCLRCALQGLIPKSLEGD